MRGTKILRGLFAPLVLGGILAGQVSHREALAKGQSCLDCHADIRASISARRPGDRGIRFNHQLHLAMGNLAPVIAAAIDKKKYLGPQASLLRARLNTQDACQACHRGLGEADRATPAHFPAMADCLVCHDKIDNPFSCEKCHSVSPAQLKPPSHTPDYMDTHSSGKLQLDKPSCVSCHGVDFRCLGCH